MRMIGKVELQIPDVIRDALLHQGIPDYPTLVRYSGGEVVSRKGKRKVRRLSLVVDGIECNCYLKQVRFESPAIVKRNIRKGAGRHTSAYFEYLQIERQKALGLPVMGAWGWGEKTLFGWPVSGVILLREVPGLRLDKQLALATSKDRQALLGKFGMLIRRLHDHGIDSVTRLQDVVCSTDGDLVLIDREHGELTPRHPTIQIRYRLLSKTYLKALQDMPELSLARPQLKAMLEGYIADSEDITETLDATLRSAEQLARSSSKYQDLASRISDDEKIGND